MRTIRRFVARLTASITRRRDEARLRAEVEEHLTLQTEANVKAGMTVDEARRQAVLRFGAPETVKERYRDQQRLPVLEVSLSDIRSALRSFNRHRGFTAVVVFTLALGIGANSAVFTIVNAMLLRSLPFDQPDRVVRISTRDGQGRVFGASLDDFQDWQRDSRAFAGMALVYGSTMSVGADNAPPAEYRGAYISANGFSIIGVSPVIGRGFTAEDDRPGAPAVMLLSHGVWLSRYGARSSVIGQAVRLNTLPATVVGVMPEGVNFPFIAEVWLPLSQTPSALTRTRNARDFLAYGRLGEHVTIERAQRELATTSAQLAAAYPDTNKDRTAVVRPYSDGVVGTQTRLLLWSLMGAVGFVLLIACANVANLLLTRAADQSREIAVRTSIGATRWRIVRQLLLESVLLASISGLAGLGLAYYGTRWFDAVTRDIGRPYWMTFTMDVSVFLFCAAICLVTGLMFGLAPALYVSRTGTYDVLKDGSRSATVGRRAQRWSGGLIVAQLTLTVVLLAGAGFMGRSFLRLSHMDIGFDPAQLVTMSIALPPQKYANFDDRIAFLQKLDERLNALSVIEGASTASYLPASWGGSLRQLAIDGRPVRDRGQPAIVTMMTVGPRYFEVMGGPVLRGRPFVTTDGEPGREAMIVNARLAEMYFPGGNPIGKRIRLINDGGTPEAPKFYEGTIVGVAPTIRQRNMQTAEADPIVYIPHRQDVLMGFYPHLIVRTKGNTSVAALLRQEVASMDPDIPLTNIRTMDENLALWSWSHRVFGTMFAIFAGIAIVMAAVGLYGVTAYAVAQRRHEIGIRMALGAHARQVWLLVLRRGVTQLAIGLTIGLAGALGVGRLLQSFLVQTEPADPVTLLSVSALIVFVALVACVWPASRATRVDPLVALRYE